MFRKNVFFSLFVAGLLAMSAFTIVKNPDPSESKRINLSDAERMKIFVDENWEEKFVPFFLNNLHPLTNVSPLLEKDLEQAGTKFGLRPKGEANPWNFVVSGEGTVLVANTESRAATATIDIDGDQEGDIILQLGPVIKGTSLRDAATFLKFSDFRDQIEYAKLARALNAQVHESVLQELPLDSLEGKVIAFTGAFTVRSTDMNPLVTPIAVDLIK